MVLISLTEHCLNCSAILTLDEKTGILHCPYCGAQYRVSSDETAADQMFTHKTIRDSAPIEKQMQYAVTKMPERRVEINYEKIVTEEVERIIVPSKTVMLGDCIAQDKRYRSAVEHFSIHKQDECYLLFDSTRTGTCSNGMALCRTGLYYCANTGRKLAQYIPWVAFARKRISASGKVLYIDSDGLNAASEKEQLLKLLYKIQERIEEERGLR